MTTRQVTFPLFDSWAVWVTRAMEFLWLLTAFFVPLMFVTPAIMDNGHDIPKVTLYRSLVGLMAVLWLVEWGLSGRKINSHHPRLTVSRGRSWLSAQPTRWVLVAACAMAASSLISTLLSPSIPVSFWGREPAMDGTGFYNTLSHFVLFIVLATHIKTTAQFWRLFGLITASGGVIGLYALLQYYGLDPLEVHIGGGSVISSIGNPIATGAILLMIAPPALAMALRTHGSRSWPGEPLLWVAALTILLLGIAFTQARGPMLGLAAGLIGFLALLSIALGWRTAMRGGLLLAASISITWTIVTFVPPRSTKGDEVSVPQASLASRPLSLQPGIKAALTAASPPTSTYEAEPSSIRTRLLLLKGAGGLVIRRPWFESDAQPLRFSLYLFGYGPEFFQYFFPLERPLELSLLDRDRIYNTANEAHNNPLSLTVELGYFGLASYVFLLGSLTVVAAHLVFGKLTTAPAYQKLAIAALLASLGGHTVEKMFGVPRISDSAMFWTFLAMLVALPGLSTSSLNQQARPAQPMSISKLSYSSETAVTKPVLKISLAVLLGLGVLTLTIVKNPYYALAEIRATAAVASMEVDDLRKGLRQIDRAITLAPDVGRYHVTRSKIIDKARTTATTEARRGQLAQEAYSANKRAVDANPFDVYSRLHFAESALTLASLGQTQMGEEAIAEYRRLTFMLPRYWLTHFLLGRAYATTGQLERAIEAYDVATTLNPESVITYDQRALVYASKGEYQGVVKDNSTVIQLSPQDPLAYINRGVTLLSLGQIQEAIKEFDEAVYLGPNLALAYNNRGAAYYQLGQAERSIEDLDEAIDFDPQFAEAYANRALAYALLDRDVEARQDMARAAELGFTLPSFGSDSNISKVQ